MSFILAQSDIQELLGDARHRAERAGEPNIVEFFSNQRVARTILGELLHVAVNTHFDPGAITTYQEVVENILGKVEDPNETGRYVMHEIYLGIRSTVDPWIDQGWLYDIEPIVGSDATYGEQLAGFCLTPILSPRLRCQYGDLVSISNLINHMNCKTY